jgi:hypothetical protein
MNRDTNFQQATPPPLRGASPLSALPPPARFRATPSALPSWSLAPQRAPTQDMARTEVIPNTKPLGSPGYQKGVVTTHVSLAMGLEPGVAPLDAAWAHQLVFPESHFFELWVLGCAIVCACVRMWGCGWRRCGGWHSGVRFSSESWALLLGGRRRPAGQCVSMGARGSQITAARGDA